ncbi:hypothetical protein J6590_018644 [Homalodisca vitripennis]|nr:hypothetical protein J6590_018644 [Homalodisca vitripennis]
MSVWYKAGLGSAGAGTDEIDALFPAILPTQSAMLCCHCPSLAAYGQVRSSDYRTPYQKVQGLSLPTYRHSPRCCVVIALHSQRMDRRFRACHCHRTDTVRDVVLSMPSTRSVWTGLVTVTIPTQSAMLCCHCPSLAAYGQVRSSDYRTPYQKVQGLSLSTYRHSPRCVVNALHLQRMDRRFRACHCHHTDTARDVVLSLPSTRSVWTGLVTINVPTQSAMLCCQCPPLAAYGQVRSSDYRTPYQKVQDLSLSTYRHSPRCCVVNALHSQRMDSRGLVYKIAAGPVIA